MCCFCMFINLFFACLNLTVMASCLYREDDKTVGWENIPGLNWIALLAGIFGASFAASVEPKKH